MEIEITKYINSDRDAIADLITSTSKDANFVRLETDETLRQSIDYFIDSVDEEHSYAIVAREKGKTQIIGCGGALIVVDDPRCYFLKSNRFGYIRLMRVAEQFRNQKIGEEILKCLMDWLSSNNVEEIQIHAGEQAVPFYTRQGFRPSKAINMWWMKDEQRK